MIPFDFEYYKPSSIGDAVKLFVELDSQGKEPVYYSGGTEIIALAVANKFHTGAVIDIKGIPECNLLEFQNDRLEIGAGLTLNRIIEANLFPLLTALMQSAVDHTLRNQITLGGNICSQTPYREGVLPFLLADSWVVIAGQNGTNTIPVNEVFLEKLRLEKGEFLVQISTERLYTQLPFFSLKRTKYQCSGYPLLTTAAVKKDLEIRVAFSGLCDYPFRSLKMEEEFNRTDLTPADRIGRAMDSLPAPPANNIHGSSEYREFLFRKTLEDLLEKFEGAAL